MTETKSVAASGGAGFTGLLTIAFIVLKLCHVIDWSWWLVLLPTLIPLGIALSFLIAALLVLLFVVLKPRRKRGNAP